MHVGLVSSTNLCPIHLNIHIYNNNNKKNLSCKSARNIRECVCVCLIIVNFFFFVFFSVEFKNFLFFKRKILMNTKPYFWHNFPFLVCFLFLISFIIFHLFDVSCLFIQLLIFLYIFLLYSFVVALRSYCDIFNIKLPILFNLIKKLYDENRHN